jgi:hypothetical protein
LGSILPHSPLLSKMFYPTMLGLQSGEGS